MARVNHGTPFDDFLSRNRISTARLARLSGYTPQHIRRVRGQRNRGSGRFRNAMSQVLTMILRRPVRVEEAFGVIETGNPPFEE
jgi:hypothetical protein